MNMFLPIELARYGDDCLVVSRQGRVDDIETDEHVLLFIKALEDGTHARGWKLLQEKSAIKEAQFRAILDANLGADECNDGWD
jgi:hypothetical protein